METDQEFYARRAAEEERAVERAITPDAKERHRQLAEMYRGKVGQSKGADPRADLPSP